MHSRDISRLLAYGKVYGGNTAVGLTFTACNIYEMLNKGTYWGATISGITALGFAALSKYYFHKSGTWEEIRASMQHTDPDSDEASAAYERANQYMFAKKLEMKATICGIATFLSFALPALGNYFTR